MSNLGEFPVGARPEFTATFRDTSTPPVVVDPTTVQFVVRPQAGAQVVYTYGVDAAVTKTSTGVYKFRHPRLTATDAGKVFHLRSNGGGAYEASDEDTFRCTTTAFTTPLP